MRLKFKIIKINNLDFEINKLLEVNFGTFENLFPTKEKERIQINFDENLNGTEKNLSILFLIKLEHQEFLLHFPRNQLRIQKRKMLSEKKVH